MRTEIAKVPVVTNDEINQALRSMKRGKVDGKDDVNIVLMKDAENIAVRKLSWLITNYLQEGRASKVWKFFTTILIHIEGDQLTLKLPSLQFSVIYTEATVLMHTRVDLPDLKTIILSAFLHLYTCYSQK